MRIPRRTYAGSSFIDLCFCARGILNRKITRIEALPTSLGKDGTKRRQKGSKFCITGAIDQIEGNWGPGGLPPEYNF